MAPKGRSVVKAPRRAAEIAASIKNARDLVAPANARIGEKLLANVGMAQPRPAHVEQAPMVGARQAAC